MHLQALRPHRFFPFRRQGVTQTKDETREKTGVRTQLNIHCHMHGQLLQPDHRDLSLNLE
ncbi:hypothetical protein AVEN_87257-1, partial [Araneus ventricosus]